MKHLKYLFLSFLTVCIYSCNDNLHQGVNSKEASAELKPIAANSVKTFKVFNKERVAFSDAYKQSADKEIDLTVNADTITKVEMYVSLACPDGGCNAWDVYANIQVFNDNDQKWYELGRYITPYKVTTAARGPRGFVFDVTDFKSLLQGKTKIRIFTEVWGADGWLVTVDFDYTSGTPEYKYTSIQEVMAYNRNSIEGIPYGETDETINSRYKTKRDIKLPEDVAEAKLRTIISGWGHATPLDKGGRGCAEWCFRTHHILLNDIETFEHYLGPLGCSQNPIKDQFGNWKPDRAGWCPGMEVPTRIDEINTELLKGNLKFEYKFQKWVNDKKAQIDNPNAYYAISTYLVMKSNKPIGQTSVSEL